MLWAEKASPVAAISSWGSATSSDALRARQTSVLHDCEQ